MSEEQSGFKVTDRRLFNPDGSARDTIREEEPAAETAPTAAATPPAAAPEPVAPPRTEERPGTGRVVAGAEEARPVQDEAEGTDPNDPTSFLNFLMSIASNAASALGMMEHPVTGERGVDLAAGKHWIDVLGMLQKKTRGNLTDEEMQILEGILADLRMQFVSLTSAAPKAGARGFTANDILGG